MRPRSAPRKHLQGEEWCMGDTRAATDRGFPPETAGPGWALLAQAPGQVARSYAVGCNLHQSRLASLKGRGSGE